MKTIVHNFTNLSMLLLEDSETINWNKLRSIVPITQGDFYVVENVVPPDDWAPTHFTVMDGVFNRITDPSERMRLCSWMIRDDGRPLTLEQQALLT